MDQTRGTFSFYNMATTMIARMVARVSAPAADMGNFKACVLGTPMPRHLHKYRDLIQAYFRRLGAQASSSAQTREGTVHAEDLIALRCHSGDVAVAWCLMCCGCDDQVALVVSQLTPEGAPHIGRRPLAQLLWCKQMHCWNGWSIITTVMLSTSSSPLLCDEKDVRVRGKASTCAHDAKPLPAQGLDLRP